MLIRIDAIHEASNLRRVPTSADADAGLTASICAQGVLQPVLVRSDPRGGSYTLVAGARRLRCARAAGLTEIPAEVQEMTDSWALAAQAAENMVRVPMHPVDQWCAVRDMMADGLTAQQATAALGLNERQTLCMERLGMLDPAVLKWIEAGDMPPESHLRAIAMAPRKTQAAAMKSKGAITDWRGEKSPAWHVIAQACRVVRFKQSHAIFAITLMQWDQDLFAQPGADDEFTTTDRETFMRLQQEALESQVADAQAKKQRIQLVDYDAGRNEPKLPPGFERIWDGNVDKPKKVECVFVALTDVGKPCRVLALDKKAAKQAEKKKAERAANPGDAAAGGEDIEQRINDDFRAPPVAEKSGITKAGLSLVAAAKTRALRETLRTGLSETSPEQLLTLMVLTWAALNVSVSGQEEPDGDAYNPDRRHFHDVAARILRPGRGLDDVSMADARTFAGEIMARVLSFGAPGHYQLSSGAAADWIGAAIGADAAIPRFDTAEFLQQVSGDQLRRAALEANLKSTGTVKALRESLVGNLPGWRPDAAEFGAPAPVLSRAADSDDLPA